MRIVQRWNEYRPAKEHAFWFAAGSVVATLVIGFGFAGWVTGGSAQEMADQAAVASHDKLAAAVCAEEFMRAADARARLAKLAALDWWERDDVVAAGGWATMPGEKEASGAVAEMCATRLADHAKI
jgi:hypothetical protein